MRHKFLLITFASSVVITPAIPLCISPSATHAQRIPFVRHDAVRVQQLEPAGWSPWRVGRVLDGTREHLWMEIDPEDDPMFRFNESTRVQVQRGKHTRTIPGAVVGGLLGAISGATFLSSTMDHMDVTGFTVVVNAMVGATVGGLIGRRFGPPKWVDVGFVDGRIPPAPLTTFHTNRVALRRNHRWTRFAPTQPDFEAFFTEHADSLRPPEGIWGLYGSSLRFAVVRESQFQDVGYAAYVLPIRKEQAVGTNDGLMRFAFNEPAVDGTLELQFMDPDVINWLRRATNQSVGPENTNDVRLRSFSYGMHRHDAVMSDGTLQMVLPDGAILRWNRLSP